MVVKISTYLNLLLQICIDPLLSFFLSAFNLLHIQAELDEATSDRVECEEAAVALSESQHESAHLQQAITAAQQVRSLLYDV